MSISDNRTDINTNTAGVSENRTAIETNNASINSSIGIINTNINNLALGVNANNQAISLNASNIATNNANIALNRAGLSDVREGLAAVASVPDLYLNVNETWTAAGGVSLYDDGFGGSETGFGGGVQFRSSTEDNWSVGAAGSVAGGAYSVRVQARIGG